MNVLMISPYFWEPQKKFLVVFWAAVNLRRRKHKVVVVCSKIQDSTATEAIEGISVYRIPAFYSPRFPWPIVSPAHLWRYMRYIIDRYRIDIVHLQEIIYPSSFLAALYCRIKHQPYVVTSHASYFGFGWGWLADILFDLHAFVIGRFIFRFAERVTVISKGQIPVLLRLGVSNDKIVFTPPGINTDNSIFKKATESQRREARKSLNLGQDDFVVGYVGRLSPEKNLGLLVDAAKILSLRIKQLKLLVVGPGYGVMEEWFKRKVADAGLQNSVLFLGWREDVDKILPAIDVFALPSLSEGLGKAFLEAMAVGVPVVATNVSGPSGVIVNGKNGLLVPRNNLNAMSEAILRLYENEALRKQIGNEGTKVTKVFSWELFTSRLETAYEEALLARGKHTLRAAKN